MENKLDDVSEQMIYSKLEGVERFKSQVDNFEMSKWTMVNAFEGFNVFSTSEIDYERDDGDLYRLKDVARAMTTYTNILADWTKEQTLQQLQTLAAVAVIMIGGDLIDNIVLNKTHEGTEGKKAWDVSRLQLILKAVFATYLMVNLLMQILGLRKRSAQLVDSLSE